MNTLNILPNKQQLFSKELDSILCSYIKTGKEKLLGIQAKNFYNKIKLKKKNFKTEEDKLPLNVRKSKTGH